MAIGVAINACICVNIRGNYGFDSREQGRFNTASLYSQASEENILVTRRRDGKCDEAALSIYRANEILRKANQRGKKHATARDREMNFAARADTTRASAQIDRSAGRDGTPP